jgi:hypothetical protein
MPVLRPSVRPSVPDPTPVGQALREHEGLARLGALMQASRRRLATVMAALPPALRTQVQAGPLDEEGWSLLASNAAVAAKLRQLLPRLETLLDQAGLQPAKVRIEITQK